MFEQPGTKLKKLAKVLFWLVASATVIAAFVLGIRDKEVYHSRMYGSGYYETETEFSPEVFFPLLIGGPISAYIGALFITGFGELVENSQQLKNSESDEAGIDSQEKNETNPVAKFISSNTEYETIYNTLKMTPHLKDMKKYLLSQTQNDVVVTMIGIINEVESSPEVSTFFERGEAMDRIEVYLEQIGILKVEKT